MSQSPKSRKSTKPRKPTTPRVGVSRRDQLEALFAIYGARQLAKRYVETPLSKLATYGDRNKSKGKVKTKD